MTKSIYARQCDKCVLKKERGGAVPNVKSQFDSICLNILRRKIEGRKREREGKERKMKKREKYIFLPYDRMVVKCSIIHSIA